MPCDRLDDFRWVLKKKLSGKESCGHTCCGLDPAGTEYWEVAQSTCKCHNEDPHPPIQRFIFPSQGGSDEQVLANGGGLENQCRPLIQKVNIPCIHQNYLVNEIFFTCFWYWLPEQLKDENLEVIESIYMEKIELQDQLDLLNKPNNPTNVITVSAGKYHSFSNGTQTLRPVWIKMCVFFCRHPPYQLGFKASGKGQS